MSKIVDVARAEIGNSELPKNSNNVKYNTWFYGKEVSGPMYAWCGAFVSWVFFHAGRPLGKIDFLRGFASCPFAYTFFSKKKLIIDPKVTKPVAGDIVIFDWNHDNRFDHTGIFVQDCGDGVHFIAIEGNTAIGNDSNGGEVMERKRKYAVATFIHIPESKPLV